MEITTNNQLDIIKFNLEVFKIKNLIDKKDFSKTIKGELDDYLFKLDENDDFQLNKILVKHTFSKYDVLNIVFDYLNEIPKIENLSHVKEGLNNKLDEIYFAIELPDLNQSDFKKTLTNYEVQDYYFDEYAIDDLISKISLDDFVQKESKGDLIKELNELIEIPIFKYISLGLDDLEVSKLINKIKTDIRSNSISGDISDIVDYYFEEYKTLKNHLFLNHFLNEYVRSPSFIEISKDFDDEIIINIIDKVRNEIYDDKTMDKSKIILKLKDCFKKELIKRAYFDELEKFRQKIPEISKNRNLTVDEVEEILNEATVEINEDKVEGSLNEYLDDKYVSKIELNQSKSRIKLNNILKNGTIRDKITFEESDLEKIAEEIGELIYDNKIRSHEITEELIIEKLRGI